MAEPLCRSIEGLVASYPTVVRAEGIAEFATLSGEDYEVHRDGEAMAMSSFGTIIAHGALLVGYMSAAGTKAIRRAQARGNTTTPVSLGYDRMRLVAPVFPGDTLTVTTRIREVDAACARSIAALEVAKQTGEVVAVADHVMKRLRA